MMTLIMDCNVSTEVKFYSNEEKGTQAAHFNVAYNQGKDQPPMFSRRRRLERTLLPPANT